MWTFVYVFTWYSHCGIQYYGTIVVYTVCRSQIIAVVILISGFCWPEFHSMGSCASRLDEYSLDVTALSHFPVTILVLEARTGNQELLVSV